jgi:SAM-dependent methyltransferase
MLSRLKRDLTMAEAARAPGGARVDLLLVAEMVVPGSKVLDIGAGDGELLRILGEQRGVDGRGIELSREGVNECVAKGLAVIQGDADTDLADYPNDAFDYVILSQTLQATRRPRVVMEHMLRIGRNAVVSFPNFGHWKIRLQLCLVGFAQHPFLHHQGFHRAVRRRRRQDGACGRLQRLGHALAFQRTLVVLEPVRRTGGVPAEPKGLRNGILPRRVRLAWISGRPFLLP